LQHIPTFDDSVEVVLASRTLVASITQPLPVLPVLLLLFSSLQHIPTVDDSVEVVLAALQRHGLPSAAVLGHSYGSLVAARLVRVAPQVVHTLAVVDPVSAAAAAAAAAAVCAIRASVVRLLCKNRASHLVSRQ
jgi:pimeloyl-ACP methyl ester carboxylesterase